MLRLLLAAPLLILLVLFALSNQAPVRLALWPLPGAFEAPLSLAILAGLGGGMLLGALMLWVSTFALRRRARRAEQAAALLEERLRARPAIALPPPE